MRRMNHAVLGNPPNFEMLSSRLGGIACFENDIQHYVDGMEGTIRSTWSANFDIQPNYLSNSDINAVNPQFVVSNPKGLTSPHMEAVAVSSTYTRLCPLIGEPVRLLIRNPAISR
jgi:hypothetical protein